MVSVVEPIPDGRGVFFIVEPDRDQLEELAKLIDTNSLKSIVDAVLPLARAREAFEMGLKGHTRGKIVLQVQDDN